MGLTTTKEWRWDAPGAHTLTGAVGSARILLRDFLEECGWSVIWEDAGAQKVVLRNSQAHGGSGCYVRILDDGSFTGGSRVARIDVYEAMTDIDTGTATAGGGYFWKDRTGSGGPNVYTLHGDERTCYYTNYVNGAVPPANTGYQSVQSTAAGGFGDIKPSIAGDPGVFCSLLANEGPSTSSAAREASPLIRCQGPGGVGVDSNQTLSRTHTLSATPTPCAIYGPGGFGNNAGHGFGGNAVAFPSEVAPGLGARLFLPALCVADGTLRGRFRGLYMPLTYFAGSGSHIGSTFLSALATPQLDLATIVGAAINQTSDNAVGKVFAERTLSWDDI